ncbi:MAG: carboxypeptidase-like regulatory domain-containing protein [Planctomycetota bacterium]
MIAPATDVVLRTTEVRLDAKLRVLVFDADDRPAASARVNVSAVDAAGKTLVTDAGGRAAFEGLSNDEVCVRAFQGQPSSDLTIPSEPLRVMPAGQEVELHLRRGVALIGTVVDPQGSPASGIHVMAVHQDDIFSSISDTRGRFRIAVAPGTTYDLRASHPKDKNLTGSRSGVTPGSDDVNIKLGAWK